MITEVREDRNWCPFSKRGSEAEPAISIYLRYDDGISNQLVISVLSSAPTRISTGAGISDTTASIETTLISPSVGYPPPSRERLYLALVILCKSN